MVEIKKCSLATNEEKLIDLLTEHDVDKGFEDKRKDACSFGVFDGDKQIGGIIARLNAEELHISLLAISPNNRNKDLGRLLLERCEKYAKDNGCRIITVTTQDYQAPKFYLKHGFEVFAEFKDIPFEGTKRFYLFKRV